MKKIHRLIAAVGLIIIVLLGFTLYSDIPLRFGKHIILRTQPVDPFDPLMGQYIAINYDISQVPGNFILGETVYVSLKKENNIWVFQSASKEKPRSGDFIRGEALWSNDNSTRVDYGIETYYFERNAQFPTQNLTVEVAVASSGRAKIWQLLSNDKPLDISYEPVTITS